MLKMNQLLSIIMIVILNFTLLGCTSSTKEITEIVLEGFFEDRRLSKKVSDDLFNTIKFPFVQIGFVDSRNGKVVHMIHADADLESEKPSTIIKISSITTINIANLGEMQNCNYINFDNRTELICERGPNQERQISDEIPDFELSFLEDLEAEISKAAKTSDFKIGFILASDVTNGNKKLLKHIDYIHVKPNSPLPVSEKKNFGQWSIITEKRNPCCQTVIINNTQHTICYRTSCP